MSTEVESSSLDDFFAKKDKKKTKKSKVLSELNALSQSEEKPKKKKSSKEKSSAAPTTEDGAAPNATAASTSATEIRGSERGGGGGGGGGGGEGEEVEKAADEWVEIEEKEDADYTGLKIQSLRLEEREAALKEAEGDEDDAGKGGAGANEGPWKKIEAPPIGGGGGGDKDTTEVVSESRESTPTVTGKYVPPSVRAAQKAASQQAQAPLRKRNNKLAPDVNDQDSFPTLGGSRRIGESPAGENSKSFTSLHLQNKWDSLSRGSAEP